MKKISLSIVAILFAAASVMADGGHAAAKKTSAKVKQATCTKDCTKACPKDCTKADCAKAGCTDPASCAHKGTCGGM